MKVQQIKFNNKTHNYSILIGKNILGVLSKKIKLLCPKARKIALVIDKKVPSKFKNRIKNQLKNFEIVHLSFEANEKNKSIVSVNKYLNILLSKNFNRSDLVIGIGGGITGDVVGFTASLFKRGINFFNIPTTLLAQVDSAVGGKTGVNTMHGKNLIGSFYQPKLVISDTSFLSSLPKKQMICGYAEILKHSIIKDLNFFNWLKKNTKEILNKNSDKLIFAIKKSCSIKMYFVNKDVNEKGLRMKLNFGHTFAHAIEAKSRYSKNLTHGEAVLSGMILATKLSCIKKVCKRKTLREIMDIYERNNFTYTFKKYSNPKLIENLIPYIKNDKKNNDEKINFILLNKIGKTTNPYSSKISVNNLRRYSKIISQY